jgi:hypothetical protein
VRCRLGAIALAALAITAAGCGGDAAPKPAGTDNIGATRSTQGSIPRCHSGKVPVRIGKPRWQCAEASVVQIVVVCQEALHELVNNVRRISPNLSGLPENLKQATEQNLRVDDATIAKLRAGAVTSESKKIRDSVLRNLTSSVARLTRIPQELRHDTGSSSVSRTAIGLLNASGGCGRVELQKPVVG